MFLKTPLLGCKEIEPGMKSFMTSFLSGRKWPTERHFKALHLDPDEDFVIEKIHYKESFGCLRAIGITHKGAPGQILETPLFEAGRADRMVISQQTLDTSKPLRNIQVRVFKEKKETFITGLRFTAGNEPDQVCGLVDLHEYGDCE